MPHGLVDFIVDCRIFAQGSVGAISRPNRVTLTRAVDRRGGRDRRLIRKRTRNALGIAADSIARLGNVLATHRGLAGVCVRLDGHPEILAASARALTLHWVRAMRDDPFSLLDEKTQKWVRLAHEETGRRFMIGDFESPEPPQS